MVNLINHLSPTFDCEVPAISSNNSYFMAVNVYQMKGGLFVHYLLKTTSSPDKSAKKYLQI
jgi:hypothetical protein